jgi:hypothetical protein
MHHAHSFAMMVFRDRDALPDCSAAASELMMNGRRNIARQLHHVLVVHSLAKQSEGRQINEGLRSRGIPALSIRSLNSDWRITGIELLLCGVWKLESLEFHLGTWRWFSV